MNLALANRRVEKRVKGRAQLKHRPQQVYPADGRVVGQQLKEPAQLDGWLRDGSAAYLETM